MRWVRAQFRQTPGFMSSGERIAKNFAVNLLLFGRSMGGYVAVNLHMLPLYRHNHMCHDGIAYLGQAKLRHANEVQRVAWGMVS
jgi:hypothetical protein